MDPGATIPACCQAVDAGFDWKAGLSVISAIIACGALWITSKSARAAASSAEANLTAMDREEGRLRAPVLLKRLQKQARAALTDLRSPWRVTLRVASRPEYFSLLYLQQEEALQLEPEPAVGAEVTATLERDEEALIARAHQIVEALAERYPAFRGETFLGIQRFTDIDQTRALEIAKERWRMGQDPSYFAAKIRERAKTLSDIAIDNPIGRRFRGRTMRPHMRAGRQWTKDWAEFGEFDMAGADLAALQSDREIELESIPPAPPPT
ncbi:MAG TPA: hypothetical protein VMF89_02860 [Polyangiales bacterium]|nr:hypothetical protein [Polyangiales bacterium]